MKLVPVVEFEPADYQIHHYEIPEGLGRDYLDEWHRYWQNSLADSGIIDLKPCQKGSWLVTIEELIDRDRVLEILLYKYFNKIDLNSTEDLEEQLGSLSGGYILEVTETIKIFPECCGDLGNISEWKNASEYLKREETMLWIGHPWLMVSAIDEEHLRIKRTAEYGEPGEPVILELKRSDLRSAIVYAEKKLSEFQQILLPILKKIIPNQAEEAMKLLIYGY